MEREASVEVLRFHVRAWTPNWQTKIVCDCGFQAVSKRDYAVHLADVLEEAKDGA
jgi:hypothetical protein